MNTTINEKVQHDSNLYNVKTLIMFKDYMRNSLNWNNSKIEDVFKESGCDISILNNEDNWFDQTIADKINAVMVRETNDVDVAYKVGSYFAYKSSRKLGVHLLQTFLNPSVVFKQIQKAASIYTKGSHYKLIEIEKNKAVIQSHVNDGCNERYYQCRQRAGVLKEVPALFGSESGQIKENVCFHKGGDYCEYEISWKNPPKQHPILISAGIGILAGFTSKYLFSNNLFVHQLIDVFIGLSSALVSLLFFGIKKLRLDEKGYREQKEILNEEVEKSERRYKEKILTEGISKEISKITTLDELSAKITSRIHISMKYDQVFIFLVPDENKNLLRFKGINETPNRNTEYDLNLAKDGYLNTLFTTEESHLENDFKTFQSQLTPSNQKAFEKLNLTSFVLTPIVFNSEQLGMIISNSSNPDMPLSEDDKRLLENLSKSIGVAVFNAKLFQSLEEKVEERTIQLKASNDELVRTLEDLRETQEQLVQKEKMASLGTLVSGVAHEINTPIGIAVTTASDHIEATDEFKGLYEQNKVTRTAFENYTNDSKERAELILKYMEQANNLISSFKEMAVDQEGEMKRIFNLKEYVDSVIKTLTPSLRETKLEIDNYCDSELNLNSYPGAFAQILTNFIMNSIKHAYEENEKGSIVIKAYRKSDSNQLIFSYQDDGKGIDEETRKKIFDPFFTTKRNYGGSGLGLSIIFNIVKQKLNGNITCDSKLGEGSIFEIEMPLEGSDE